MSPVNFYTTKALGREWIPSPVRSLHGRFDPAPQMRWDYFDGPLGSSSTTRSLRSKCGKVHERIMLGIGIVVVLWILAFGRRTVIGKMPSMDWKWKGRGDGVDWSKMAYGTYASTPDHLCNSVMMMESLSRLGTKAQKLILYDEFWDLPRPDNIISPEQRVLAKAKFQYGAILRPVKVQTVKPSEDMVVGGGEGYTWAQSFTKLLAFNQTDFKRILMLDSDSTIFQSMDELFLLPSNIPIAMPRAYWIPEPRLTSALTLLSPSSQEFERVQNAISHRLPTDFDMEILNSLYSSSCLVLPHDPYFLLTGELRNSKHKFTTERIKVGGEARVAGMRGWEGTEGWDVQRVMEGVKFVHFSDFPLGKPWMKSDKDVWEAVRPKSVKEREAWEWLFEDFRGRRREICGSEFVTWEGEGGGELATAMGGSAKESENVVEKVPLEVLLADPMPVVDVGPLREESMRD